MKRNARLNGRVRLKLGMVTYAELFTAKPDALNAPARLMLPFTSGPSAPLPESTTTLPAALAWFHRCVTLATVQAPYGGGLAGGGGGAQVGKAEAPAAGHQVSPHEVAQTGLAQSMLPATLNAVTVPWIVAG